MTTNEQNAMRLALLIDAENASAAQAAAILAAAEKYGRILIKRAYGDWGNGAIREWKTACVIHQLDPIQCFNFCPGKNSTDFRIVIDAMDLLSNQAVDGICIASSDSDFTSIAMRLRSGGITVIGIGSHNAVPVWKLACTHWESYPAPGKAKEASAPTKIKVVPEPEKPKAPQKPAAQSPKSAPREQPAQNDPAGQKKAPAAPQSAANGQPEAKSAVSAGTSVPGTPAAGTPAGSQPAARSSRGQNRRGKSRRQNSHSPAASQAPETGAATPVAAAAESPAPEAKAPVFVPETVEAAAVQPAEAPAAEAVSVVPSEAAPVETAPVETSSVEVISQEIPAAPEALTDGTQVTETSETAAALTDAPAVEVAPAVMEPETGADVPARDDLPAEKTPETPADALAELPTAPAAEALSEAADASVAADVAAEPAADEPPAAPVTEEAAPETVPGSEAPRRSARSSRRRSARKTVPVEAAQPEAAPVEAAPAEAAPAQAVPTEVVPVEAVPTEAAPAEAVPAIPVPEAEASEVVKAGQEADVPAISEEDARRVLTDILRKQTKGIELSRLLQTVQGQLPGFRPELFGWRRFRTVLEHWGYALEHRGTRWYASPVPAQDAAEQPLDLRAILDAAIDQSPDGHLLLSEVCPKISKVKPDFRLADFGKKKMKDLVTGLGYTIHGHGKDQYISK